MIDSGRCAGAFAAIHIDISPIVSFGYFRTDYCRADFTELNPHVHHDDKVEVRARFGEILMCAAQVHEIEYHGALAGGDSNHRTGPDQFFGGVRGGDFDCENFLSNLSRRAIIFAVAGAMAAFSEFRGICAPAAEGI